MNEILTVQEQKYKGPITTLDDLKKRVFMNEVKTNEIFLDFIHRWGEALDQAERKKQLSAERQQGF